MSTQACSAVLDSVSLEPQVAHDETDARVKDRILIVDDSRVVRKVYSAFLSSRFDCIEAASFSEAMTALRRFDFAVVVTDIIMPGLSGIELLRRVIQDYPSTQIIVASSIDRPQRALDAIRLGAFDYLIKPCEPAVLELTVERALKRRNLIGNARRHKLELERQNAELVKSKSERERLQVQFAQSSKMASLGQLAAGVAHELNNPVGFVHANLEILDTLIQDFAALAKFYDGIELSAEQRTELDEITSEIRLPLVIEDIRSMLADCREGTERIRGITQNLRTFSRLDEASYKQTDIHEGIEATIRLASQYLHSGRISLVRNYSDLPLINAFSGQLNQVWMNLLVNAFQAIGTNAGQVTITTSVDENNVWVEFTDTGCGIPIQNMEQIFDPFYTTKPVGEGTGLGLSISFGIIERHGGSMLASSDLGKGTTFNVRLPRDFEPDLEDAERSIDVYDRDGEQL